MARREKSLRALIYARASSHRQAEKGLSVPGQLRELRRYCSQHGYEIVKEFHDDGFSGTTDKRPGFQEMVAYAEEHPDEIDAVLVWSFSRFARNRVHAVVYKARLHRLGIKVISISEPLPDGPEADLLEAVVEAMDAHRSIRLARDVMRGIREAILQGFYPLSTVPIGYRREEVKVGGVRRFKLVPDEATAPLVRRIFEAYVKEGKGAKEIAQELNAQKLLTPRGRRWNRSAILRIISNPIYIGTLVVKFDSENARFLPAEQREIVAENFCTPLIPVEIFELAQRYREERARAHPQHLASADGVEGRHLVGVAPWLEEAVLDRGGGGRGLRGREVGYLQHPLHGQPPRDQHVLELRRFLRPQRCARQKGGERQEKERPDHVLTPV